MKKENLKSIFDLCEIISQDLKENSMIPLVDPLIYEKILSSNTNKNQFLDSISDENLKKSLLIIDKYLPKLSEINFFNKLDFIEYIFHNKNFLPNDLWTLILQLLTLFLNEDLDEDFTKDLNSLDDFLNFYKPFIQSIPYKPDGILFIETLFINLVFMYSKENF